MLTTITYLGQLHNFPNNKVHIMPANIFDFVNLTVEQVSDITWMQSKLLRINNIIPKSITTI